MNSDNFSEIIDEVFNLCLDELDNKSKGYKVVGKETDRLAFFKMAGAFDGETPEQALKGMWKKHLVSIFQIIKWTKECPEEISMDIVKEKIKDSINYHVFLYALLYERDSQIGTKIKKACYCVGTDCCPECVSR